MDATGQLLKGKILKRRITNIASSRHSKLRKCALLQQAASIEDGLVFSDGSSMRSTLATDDTDKWFEIDLGAFRAAAEEARSQCRVTPLEALEGWEGEEDLVMFNESSSIPKSMSD